MSYGGARAAARAGRLPGVIAYVVWAGPGTVGAAVGAALLFGAHLIITAIAGITTVIVGTTLIKLGANTGG